MNNCVLSGFLGKDPERHYGTTDGKNWTLVVFTLAVGDYRGGQDATDWFDCKMWGDRAEKLYELFKKGSAIEITGKIIQEHYETKEGDKRNKHVINVNSWDFPPAKKSSDNTPKSEDGKEGKSFKSKEERDVFNKQQEAKKTVAPF